MGGLMVMVINDELFTHSIKNIMDSSIDKTNDSQPSMDWVCGELQSIAVDEQMIADVLLFQRSEGGA